MQTFFSGRRAEFMIVLLTLVIAVFFSTYKLTSSPPTWFDEGFITQSAMNLTDSGKLGIRVSPAEVAGKAVWFSTGYPAAYPVGWALKIFGNGLIYARSVMALFIVLFVIISYFLARKIWGTRIAVFASLLTATFAPLYGNGKNVLGEVPGLFFLFLFLFFITNIDRDRNKISNYVLAGLAFGLCVFTKFLFLVLPVAVLLAYILKRKEVFFNKKGPTLFIFSFILTAIIAYITQVYETDTFLGILNGLGNPYAVKDIWALALFNLKRFFTEAGPMHFLVLLLVWAVSLFVRKYRFNDKISFAEVIMSIFAFLIFIAYFRIVGWYRYFFPAQMIMVFCLPAALSSIFSFIRNKGNNFKEVYLYIALLGIALFQIYQLSFDSWVANYYKSTGIGAMENYFGSVDKNKKIFIFNSPELAIFLPNRSFYQYLEISDNIVIGKDELSKIENGEVDLIYLDEKQFSRFGSLFVLYSQKENVGKYKVLEITK